MQISSIEGSPPFTKREGGTYIERAGGPFNKRGRGGVFCLFFFGRGEMRRDEVR